MRAVRHPVPVLFLVFAIACFVLPARAGSEGSFRMPGGTTWDAELVDTMWLEVLLDYRDIGDAPFQPAADDLVTTFAGAWLVVPNLEVGVAVPYVSRDFDRDRLGSPSGLGDVAAWAKYRLGNTGNAAWSIGASLSVPTGDEDDFLGTGNLDPAAWIAAGVPTRGDAFVQAHVGLRANGDFDGAGLSADGKTSVIIGFGGFMPTANGMTVFASFDLETERWDGGDSAATLLGGARWPISDGWQIEAKASVGLADAAPDLTLGLGLVFHP